MDTLMQFHTSCTKHTARHDVHTLKYTHIKPQKRRPQNPHTFKVWTPTDTHTYTITQNTWPANILCRLKNAYRVLQKTHTHTHTYAHTYAHTHTVLHQMPPTTLYPLPSLSLSNARVIGFCGCVKGLLQSNQEVLRSPCVGQTLNNPLTAGGLTAAKGAQ